ncbi:hypothetical protein Cni_G26450 [Canna indica]|uniref:Cytochrome P450 n=1 Tax=Canna indica TaxID=4628 RepID=A0AAQ3L662_9LILI|nr:hypothetical protein Cni_G26450 [Canna indica]
MSALMWGSCSSYALFSFHLLLLVFKLLLQVLGFGVTAAKSLKLLPLPVIGHLHLLRGPLHRSLASLSARCGSAALLRFGSRPVLVVFSAAAVEECFTTNDICFSNRPLLLSGVHFNYNGTTLATVPYGPEWRNLRRIAALPLFSSARLSALAPLRAAHVHSLLRSLSRGDGFHRVEIRPRLVELLLNTLMEMVVGKRHGDGKRFARIVEEAFHLSGTAEPEDFLPFLRLLGVSKVNKRMQRLQKEIDGLLQEMVDERRRKKMEGEKERGDHDGKETLVDVLLSMQEMEPKYYTDIIIKGMIEIMILAGTDTTAVTIEWAMALLLNHPDVMRKLHDEIETFVGHQRLVSDSDLPNLVYLNNVIKETLRLFPPGPLLVPRESTTECRIAGISVPRGTMLLVNAYKVHRDPELWKDPTQFKPDRFERTTTKGVKGEGYRFVPFGGGRRRCPGEAMALRSIKLTLVSLIQCFEWKRVGEEEVDLSEGEGLTVPMATPLQALYMPRPAMIDVLSLL